MNFAFSTNAFTRFPLADAILAIKQAGYAGVEILADEPHAYPGKIDTAFTANVAKLLEQTGLTVSSVNANCTFGYWRDAPPEPYFEPSLISPNPQHRSDRARLIMKTIDFARDIGARNISITSGRTLGATTPAKAVEYFTNEMKVILDHADSANIDVGIECEPGLYLEWATELREWIDRLGSKRLGANLDIGHSQVLGESIPETIKLLRGRIWNMHVEDIPGRKHYHMIPGEGTLDWKSFAAAVRAIKYDRFLTVELYTHTADPHTAARKSHEFLSRLFS
jgi:sugar phosphate isomerase/epimerase